MLISIASKYLDHDWLSLMNDDCFAPPFASQVSVKYDEATA